MSTISAMIGGIKSSLKGIRNPTRNSSTPSVSTGKQAGPLEDVGGPAGYADYVRDLAAGRAEEDEEFDPNAFDADEVTKKLRKVR